MIKIYLSGKSIEVGSTIYDNYINVEFCLHTRNIYPENEIDTAKIGKACYVYNIPYFWWSSS